MISDSARKKWRSVLATSLTGIAIGIAVGAIRQRLGSDPVINGVINGATIGFIIAFTSSLFELFYFPPRFRRATFSTVLMVRSFFYLALITGSAVAVIFNYARIKEGLSLTGVLHDPGFREFLFGGELYFIILVALAGSFAINFLRQINRMLGQNVLVNFITGKYHQPVVEERIFMFLDLKSSTTLAEQLGLITYHNLLNDFFFDITGPIVESHGEIYQYVGDEVVVTWSMEKGLDDACCIRCYFRIAGRIEQLADRYRAKYGLVPAFKAGFHYGSVVTAEVGDIKKEIAIHGDAINTTSRIQSECNGLGRTILLSGELLDRLPRDAGLNPEIVGRILLRGKLTEIDLYTVMPGEAPGITVKEKVKRKKEKVRIENSRTKVPEIDGR